jgi:adenylate cyclase
MAAILLVDDNLDTIRPLARLLEYMGHKVHCVASGAEALGYLQAVRPQLVLLDVSMPEMDGLQVLQRMHDDETLATLPVLMYTALSDDTRRRQAMQLGARDYLVKGQTNWGDLQAKINHYMIH